MNSQLGTWRIADQKAFATYNNSTTTTMRMLARPITEAYLNTKVEVEIDNYPSGQENYTLRQQADAAGTRYEVRIDSGSQTSPSTYRLLIYYCVAGSSCTYINAKTGLTLTNKVKLVAEAVSDSATQTTIKATLYDITGTETQIGTVSAQNSTPELQKPGTVSMSGYTPRMYVDNFSVWSDVTDEIMADSVVEVGKPVSIKLQSWTDTSAFTWSDEGAGGTFSVATSSSGETLTYTPATVGTINLTATSVNGLTLDTELFASPYSTTIGFMGDSITSQASYTPSATAMKDALGTGYTTVFSAMSGATSGSYANDDSSILTNAINAFKSRGVDVVHIMLGTNDFCGSMPTATHKANMTTIIEALKTAGFRSVILSRPIYATASNCVSNLNLAAEQNTVREELAEQYSGFVRIGDTEAYDWFEAYTGSALADGVHPNSFGFEWLERFWANAIKADLEYEIAPARYWAMGENSFTLGESGTLTFSVDKYFEEFVGVKVDGVDIAASDYTATAGSTVIELSNAYLNTLAAGSHTLTVAFNGGVSVSSSFTILAQNTGGNNNGGNSGGSNIPGAPNTALL